MTRPLRNSESCTGKESSPKLKIMPTICLKKKTYLKSVLKSSNSLKLFWYINDRFLDFRPYWNPRQSSSKNTHCDIMSVCPPFMIYDCCFQSFCSLFAALEPRGQVSNIRGMRELADGGSRGEWSECQVSQYCWYRHNGGIRVIYTVNHFTENQG